ncbi:MAG: hypothetical protein Q4B22_11315 [Eubacteriales bacterium]|nr:hypothetical protein [Eubacteriales bacterium]
MKRGGSFKRTLLGVFVSVTMMTGITVPAAADTGMDYETELSDTVDIEAEDGAEITNGEPDAEAGSGKAVLESDADERIIPDSKESEESDAELEIIPEEKGEEDAEMLPVEEEAETADGLLSLHPDEREKRELTDEEAAALLEAEAAEEELLEAASVCVSYKGSNRWLQDYFYWAAPITSSLTAAADGGWMRVQEGAVNGKYLVEYYDAAYKYKSTKLINAELPIYGGFYSDGANYYILSGQKNESESNSVEVFRVTKYSTGWNRLGQASLYGANTYDPLDAGSARFAHSGNYLFVRTAHEMYQSSDGYHHQANVQMMINTKTMKMVDSAYEVSNRSNGYASHSFNQFIKIDNGKLVGLDHGDAYPRAVGLYKYNSAFTASGFNKATSYVSLLDISGSVGSNSTGVSVGGFEVTGSNYMAAGNSVAMGDGYNSYAVRNIFTAVVDKNLSSKPVVRQLTSYTAGTGGASTPQLVKFDSNTFLLLWMHGSKLCYCRLNGSGQAVSGIYEKDGDLSDCAPVVKNGKCIWYVWNQEKVTFYELSIGSLNTLNARAAVRTHNYAVVNASKNSNKASRVCRECGASESFTTPDSMKIYAKVNGKGQYAAAASGQYDIGGYMDLLIETDSSAQNKEITVKSSNPAVIKVTGKHVEFAGTGSAELKIYPTYRPSLCVTLALKVVHTCEAGAELRNASGAGCGAAGYSGDLVCSGCGVTIEKGKSIPATGAHKGGRATCGAAAICDSCGQAYGSVNTSNHVGGRTVRNKKAAGTEAGYTGDTCCSTCGTVLEKGKVIPAVKPKTQPMYRLYNPGSGEHFYTASAGEKEYLVKAGWKYEGVGWNAPVTSKTPVYRLYNSKVGDHHYTTSASERNMLAANGWTYEKICWYSDDARGIALYRLYNPNAATGSHNYTTKAGERDYLVSAGWKYEGIGWYGVK